MLQTELNLLEQDRAAFGQFNTAIDPVKQSCSQLFFQTLDLLADRWLRGAQLNRRRSKTAVTGRRFESAQQVERQIAEGFIHKLCLS